MPSNSASTEGQDPIIVAAAESVHHRRRLGNSVIVPSSKLAEMRGIASKHVEELLQGVVLLDGYTEIIDVYRHACQSLKMDQLEVAIVGELGSSSSKLRVREWDRSIRSMLEDPWPHVLIEVVGSSDQVRIHYRKRRISPSFKKFRHLPLAYKHITINDLLSDTKVVLHLLMYPVLLKLQGRPRGWSKIGDEARAAKDLEDYQIFYNFSRSQRVLTNLGFYNPKLNTIPPARLPLPYTMRPCEVPKTFAFPPKNTVVNRRARGRQASVSKEIRSRSVSPKNLTDVPLPFQYRHSHFIENLTLFKSYINQLRPQVEVVQEFLGAIYGAGLRGKLTVLLQSDEIQPYDNSIVFIELHTKDNSRTANGIGQLDLRLNNEAIERAQARLAKSEAYVDAKSLWLLAYPEILYRQAQLPDPRHGANGQAEKLHIDLLRKKAERLLRQLGFWSQQNENWAEKYKKL